jgi:tetratricopeptide (TPR) repeat protein
MKYPSRFGFLAILAIGAFLSFAVLSTASAQTVNGKTVSKAVAKPLKEAQDAMKARRYSEALSKLQVVQSTPGKTPYDQYLVDEMRGYIAVNKRDYAEAVRAYEASLKSGFVSQSEMSKRVVNLAQLNYQLKRYDQTLEYGNRAIKGGYANDNLYTLVAQAHFLKGDYRSAQRFSQTQVDAALKRGQVPKESYLQFLFTSCTKLNDNPCVTSSLEKLVTHYPKAEYWQNLLYSMFQASGTSDKNQMHLYRLASEVDALKRARDYTEMAQLAQEEGAYGEADRILRRGFERKIFADERSLNQNKRLLAVVQSSMAQNKVSLTKEATAAAAAKTGNQDVSVGLAYLSYQQFDPAIAAFTRALSKPLTNNAQGGRTAAEVRLLLGIAQLEAGKRDAAMQSFKAVKGDPKLERLANLWGLHAKRA